MIKYEIENPEKIKGIKLNYESSSELNCSNNIWYKECLVEKNHFTKSGIYYTHHIIGQNILAISYEVSPIKVILKDINPFPSKDDNNHEFIIIISVIVGVFAISIIAYFLYEYYQKNKKFFCKREDRKDPNDYEEIIKGEDKDSMNRINNSRTESNA